MSAFLAGRKKTKRELSAFLFTRGLWLVFIELTIVNFAWFFDTQFKTEGLLVIWALGISMIVLAALIHLPKKIILIFSCLLIFGHNLLDSINMQGKVWWAILHQFEIFSLSSERNLFVVYPLIPWIAVMSLGYCFGSLYDSSFDGRKRRKLLNGLGIASLLLFILLRGFNLYGNPTPFVQYETLSKSLMSFLNPAKYPPSLQYLLMTLGGAFIFLANTENWDGKLSRFFSTFGRVPFFYYILHIYLIHIIALFAAELSGWGWKTMILSNWVTEMPTLKGYGFNLWIVYLVWGFVIAVLFPFCKKFEIYKMKHKEKKWLSYL